VPAATGFYFIKGRYGWIVKRILKATQGGDLPRQTRFQAAPLVVLPVPRLRHRQYVRVEKGSHVDHAFTAVSFSQADHDPAFLLPLEDQVDVVAEPVEGNFLAQVVEAIDLPVAGQVVPHL
jgi:hypothetical protein